MKRRKLAVIGVGLLVGSVFILVAGYFFYVAFIAPDRIVAIYPGLEMQGTRDWWLGWQYDRMSVTSPADADLNVQLGPLPALRLKNLTPALVEKNEAETNVNAFVQPLDCPADFCGMSSIAFRDGAVVYARLDADSRVVLSRGKNWFTLPVSQKRFDAVFGKPLGIRTYKFWL